MMDPGIVFKGEIVIECKKEAPKEARIIRTSLGFILYGRMDLSLLKERLERPSVGETFDLISGKTEALF